MLGNFNIYFILMLSGSLLALCRCAKTATFEIEAPNQLVINAIATPNEPLKVFITQSRLPTRNFEFEPVRDATVILQSNGYQWLFDKFVAPGPLGDVGHYSYVGSNLNIEPNQLYQLNIKAPGFTGVSATMKIPPPPIIDSFQITNEPEASSIVNGIIGYNLTAKLKYTIIDPAKEKNYYAIRIVYNSDYVITTIPPPRSVRDSLNVRTIGFDIENLPETTFTYLLRGAQIFTDQSFDGQRKEIEASISGLLYLKNKKPDFVTLEVWSINEEYYKYIISFNQQSIIRNDPFAEPNNVYTNISGGLGLLSGYSKRIYTIDIK